MNKYQKKINLLLNEVIELCENHQIPWFVSGRSAMRCYQGNMYAGGFLDMELTIPIEDVFKFIQAGQQLQNRYVEGCHNNPNFPGLYLKYVDTTTTLINYNEGFACQARGFFVKINLLRKVPIEDKALQKAVKYENLMEDTAKTYVDMTGETSRLERFLFRAKKLLNKTYYCKVFNQLIDIYSCPENVQTAIRTIDGGMHYFEKNRFTKLVLCEVEERLVWLPENAEEYFRQCYGVEWKSYASTMRAEGKEGDIIHDGINYLVSLTIAYPFFVEELKRQGINKKFLKKRQKNLEIAKKDSEVLAPVNEAWNLANRAGDLWNVFDHYKEKKEELRNLYDAGELFLLEKELQYYDDVVQKYADLKMGFMFDREIWDMYLNVKQYTASKEEADSIRKLAAEDEKLQIQLRDMEKEIDESFGLYS